jgi:hypothetical protein
MYQFLHLEPFDSTVCSSRVVIVLRQVVFDTRACAGMLPCPAFIKRAMVPAFRLITPCSFPPDTAS